MVTLCDPEFQLLHPHTGRWICDDSTLKVYWLRLAVRNKSSEVKERQHGQWEQISIYRKTWLLLQFLFSYTSQNAFWLQPQDVQVLLLICFEPAVEPACYYWYRYSITATPLSQTINSMLQYIPVFFLIIWMQTWGPVGILFNSRFSKAGLVQRLGHWQFRITNFL